MLTEKMINYSLAGLVSFEGMTETGIRIMNMATGTCVCILVLELGINLLLKSKTDKRI